MKTETYYWLAGGLATLVVGYVLIKKVGATSPGLLGNIIKDMPSQPNAGTRQLAPPNSLPPAPTVGATVVPVYTPPSFQPSDVITPTAIVGATEMTVRQLQAAFNILGASLTVNGQWDIPTQQAVWDWQYLHTKDNPYNPLNVTGEIDQLTQTSIQAAVGKATGVQSGFY